MVEARAELEKNMGYIRGIVNTFVIQTNTFRRSFDIEDMYQEAYIAFLHACEVFDENKKECTLMTYAAKAITNRIIDVMQRKEVKNKRYELYLEDFDTDGYELPVVSTNDLFNSVHDKIVYDNLEKLMDELIDQAPNKTHKYGLLTMRHQYKCALGKADYSRKQLAERLGVSQNYLSVCLNRVREIYKDQLRCTIFDL